MSEPWCLLALPPLDPALWTALLGDDAAAVRVLTPGERTPAGVLAAAAEAEIILGDWSGLRVDAAVLAAAPRLAAVIQPSAGTDAIDIDACAAAAVPVTNAAGANAVSVAEWCLAATLAVQRQLPVADAQMREGVWPQTGLPGRELSGSRVGIVGMGRIGVACAERYAALGATVSWWSRSPRPDGPATGGATWRALPDLLATSDVLVVVIALGETTRGLLGAPELARLPAGAVVVNAARGGIVSEDAVARAVRAGALTGAAFDVFATEPLPPDSPLRADPRIWLSPHRAGASTQAQSRIVEVTVANLRRVLRAEPLTDVVNGVSPQVRRR